MFASNKNNNNAIICSIDFIAGEYFVLLSAFVGGSHINKNNLLPLTTHWGHCWDGRMKETAENLPNVRGVGTELAAK